jgi:RNA polymerase sigma-70 factor, ECF subfamily
MSTRAQPIDIDPGTQAMIYAKAFDLRGRYGFTANDSEDIEQELLLGCFRKLPRWDASRSCRRTFLRRVVNNRIATLVEEQMAGCRDYRVCGISLNDPVEFATGESVELGEAVSADDHEARTGRSALSSCERVELRIDIASVISRMPPQLATLASLLKAVSVVEAGRRLRLSRSTVYRRVAEIREAFERAGLRRYQSRAGQHAA